MKTITLSDKVEKAATSLYLCALKHSAETDSEFSTLINVNFDGNVKPLLVVGRAYRLRGQGHCMVTLNPDKSLLSKLLPGSAYHKLDLIEIVQGKCDLMLDFWIDNYGIRCGHKNQYRSRKASPAKFSIT